MLLRMAMGLEENRRLLIKARGTGDSIPRVEDEI